MAVTQWLPWILAAAAVGALVYRLSRGKARDPAAEWERYTHAGRSARASRDLGVSEKCFLLAIGFAETPDNLREPTRLGASLNDLGSLYMEQERYEEARPLFERSLLIAEAHAAGQPSLPAVLNNLAGLHLRRGSLLEAELLARRCVRLYEASDLRNHPASADTANAFHTLAATLMSQRKYAEAEAITARAVAILEASADPPPQPLWDRLRATHALLLRKIGRITEANELDRAVRGKEVFQVLLACLFGDQRAFASLLTHVGILPEKQSPRHKCEGLMCAVFCASQVVADFYDADTETAAHVMKSCIVEFLEFARETAGEANELLTKRLQDRLTQYRAASSSSVKHRLGQEMHCNISGVDEGGFIGLLFTTSFYGLLCTTIRESLSIQEAGSGSP